MKKTAIFILGVFGICFFALNPAYTATVTVAFDATPGTKLDPGVEGVFGFEFAVESDDPNWSFTRGSIIPDDWILFSFPSPVQGFTGAGTPLTTGTLGTLNFNDDLFSLSLNNFILSDINGDPSGFVEGTDFFISFEDTTNTYSISAVPLPSTIILLAGGLIGLLVLRSRRS
ncbi:MAG: PEP-CTERM sorting domain-containing protein [Desulfobacterales bacterium]|nr:MAG: PEP-CTERM sorting domain-containing protein [Desulfobacterales bacterium]